MQRSTVSEVTFHDCCDGCELDYSRQLEEALIRLRELAGSGSMRVLHVGPYASSAQEFEAPLTYYTHYTQSPNKICVESSRYVGRFEWNDQSLVIEPRFGRNVLALLLFAAANVYLPDALGRMNLERSDSLWLLFVLWLELLKECLGKNFLPRTYVRESGNLRAVKGRIDFRRDALVNMADRSRVYCSWRRLSPDNTISRTLLHILTLKNVPSPELRDLFAAHRQYADRLLAEGVRPVPVALEDIKKIIWTPMNEVYRPLIDLSSHIIASLGTDGTNGRRENVGSFFIDIAELWEAYLLRTLKRRLPKEYMAFSPNVSGGDFLLQNGMRELRPDIIISRDGVPVMIIDAKYKKYSSFGRTASKETVSREDLYQLTAYMHHYAAKSEKLVGLISSPFGNACEAFPFSAAENQRLGLVNLDLEKFKSKSVRELKPLLLEEEERYVTNILSILQAL